MGNALSSTQLQHPATLHLSEKYLHIKEAQRRKMSFILMPWGSVALRQSGALHRKPSESK